MGISRRSRLAALAAEPLRVGNMVRLFEALAAAEPSRRRPPDADALQPVAELLARVGDPHRALRIIHVATSNGKDSTAFHSNLEGRSPSPFHSATGPDVSQCSSFHPSSC